MAGVTDRIWEAYRREYNRNPVFTLFLTSLLVLFVVFVIAAIITGGESVYNIFVWDHNNTFMDYFNSIMYSSDNPYTKWTVMYPPLVTVLYAILGHFTIPFINVEQGEVLSFVLRDSQMGLMSYFFVMFVTFYLLYRVFSKLTAKSEVFVRGGILFLLIVFSYPFLFAFERGNNILLTVVFCFIFLMGYRSENRIVRYISYIALGCAAGFKLYPAILGLLVLRERNLKEILICGAIGVILVLFPFVFTDGTIAMLLETIGWYTDYIAGSNGIINIMDIIFAIFDGFVSTETLSTVSTLLGLSILILSALIIIFDKRMSFWKMVALISCNLIIGPGIGTPYLFVYVALPLLYFLTSEKEMSNGNLFFLICFVMIMGLFVGSEVVKWDAMASIKTVFVIGMTAVLLAEGIRNIYRDYVKKENVPALSDNIE